MKDTQVCTHTQHSTLSLALEQEEEVEEESDK